MQSSKSYFKRYARVGPGGWRCACCGPAPGPSKKAAIRRWKKALDTELTRRLMKESETEE